MNDFPLIRQYGTGAPFAYQDGVVIGVARFLHDVARLASMLPDRPHILNLCADRYRFTVGFAAALQRRQISLLPPNHTPDLIGRLCRRYPGLYCLTDAHNAFEPAGNDFLSCGGRARSTGARNSSHSGCTNRCDSIYVGLDRRAGRIPQNLARPREQRPRGNGFPAGANQAGNGDPGNRAGATYVRPGIHRAHGDARRLGFTRRPAVLYRGHSGRTESFAATARAGHHPGSSQSAIGGSGRFSTGGFSALRNGVTPATHGHRSRGPICGALV